MKNGLYCSGGNNWISIDYNGNVSVCNSLLGNESGSLGNIFDHNVTIFKEPFSFRCPFQTCMQVCDRHWTAKKIYKDDIEIDSQNYLHTKFTMLFCPTFYCNYSCVYCSSHGKRDDRPSEKWIEGFSHFFEINNVTEGNLHITGGEPLCYDGIEKLFTFFYSKNFKISITTNLSINVYENLISCTTPDYFHIVNCSLHPSNRNFNWDLFKNGVQLLKLMGYNVAVNFVGHPIQLTLAPEYNEWCKNIGVKFSLIPFMGKIGNSSFVTVNDYPEPMRNIITNISHPNLLDTNKFIDGKRV